MKICCVVGARPQFVKAGALFRASSSFSVDLKLIHTGQHFDTNMSEVFFNELNLPIPNYNLNIGGLSQGAMTGRMIERLEDVFNLEKPDNVLVFGDTNSTLAAAMAACKLHIPVSHVEAGLRSFNKKMPEEINRILTDHCSEYLFTPTIRANENLKKESIDSSKIFYVGDIMMDSLHFFAKEAEKKSTILQQLNLRKKEYALATLHRAENIYENDILKNLFLQLFKFSENLPLIFPLHPATKKLLIKYDLLNEARDKFILLEPLGYFDMVHLERNASLILTDSGGIQKEAYFFNVPCITLRRETEWIELVEEGYNILAGNNPDSLFSLWEKLQNRSIIWKSNIYGDGTTGEKILDIIKDSYSPVS